MLASMCMRVQNGNLCMIKDDNIPNNYGDVVEPRQQLPRPVSNINISANTMNNNSYIYNKYFQKYKQNDQRPMIRPFQFYIYYRSYIYSFLFFFF